MKERKNERKEGRKAGNFPNLLKNISLYIHEGQQTPQRISMEIHRHHSENADGQ